MKKIFALAAVAAIVGFAASCQKEEALTPTNIEKEWAKNIDLSNSYVKQLFEQTGVAILTEYDDTLDVFYQGADYGVITSTDLTHIAAADKDKAIEWLKTNVLDCFSTDCIKTYFPRRLFLCNTLRMSSEPGFTGTWVHELRWTNNFWSVNGAQHAFPFAQGMAVCINVETLFNPNTQIDYNKQYRSDIMNLIVDELFMKNDWMDEIRSSEDIFPEDVTMLYGLNVLDQRTYNSMDQTYYISQKGMYRTWYGISPKHPRFGDPVTMYDWTKMSLEGYFEFGFPDNGMNGANANGGGDFVWPTGTPKTYTSTYNDDGVSKSFECDGYAQISNASQSGNNLKAPAGYYQDARNLIGALCDLNEVKLSVYGEFLINRLWAMSEFLRTEHGIDFRKFNPAVVTMYEMHEEF
mgnify:CR=1 FL=1